MKFILIKISYLSIKRRRLENDADLYKAFIKCFIKEKRS